VIIPDLQRLSRVATDNWVLLDRHQGLTLKVPDGRGNLVAVARSAISSSDTRGASSLKACGCFMSLRRVLKIVDSFRRDGRRRELATKNDSWLKWIWQSLELVSGARAT
jgi:hypothetical protein